MNIPDDLDKWFDGWKAGDLALCDDDDFCTVGMENPVNPQKGEVYTVSDVCVRTLHYGGRSYDMASLTLEGFPSLRLFWNKMFKKLPQITETIKDAAKRGAYSKTPVRA